MTKESTHHLVFKAAHFVGGSPEGFIAEPAGPLISSSPLLFPLSSLDITQRERESSFLDLNVSSLVLVPGPVSLVMPESCCSPLSPAGRMGQIYSLKRHAQFLERPGSPTVHAPGSPLPSACSLYKREPTQFPCGCTVTGNRLKSHNLPPTPPHSLLKRFLLCLGMGWPAGNKMAKSSGDLSK